MRIANPIYDAVFKFMMEDNDLARELLALILGEEIESLELRPQETATSAPTGGIAILRYDFKATLKLPSGEHKKVLIELQKAKHLLDIMRFRRYLGDNYRKPDEYTEDGQTKTGPLDIVTVYFLGFVLPNVPYAVLKSNNCYEDVLAGKILLEKVKEPFVNLLDHEAFFIQIPRLQPKLQTRLEKVLLVFNQDTKTDDIHQLNYTGQLDDPLISKMVRRLQFAIADEDVQRQMELEDEIGNALLEKDRLLEQKDKALEQKDKALKQKDKALEQKDKALEHKDKQLDTLRQKLMDMGINPDNVA